MDPSRISGARYHLVATYSVSVGFPLSSWIWLSDLAKPKSQSLTTQSESRSTLEGWGGNGQRKHFQNKTSQILFLSYSSKTRNQSWRDNKANFSSMLDLLWFHFKQNKDKKYQIIKYEILNIFTFPHLLVSVNNISWMKIFNGFEQLVHHITLMDILQKRAFLYHSVQVRI